MAAAQERKNVVIDRLREQTAKKKAENVRLGLGVAPVGDPGSEY